MMRCKSLGFALVALGVGIVLTLVFPAWLVLLLLGLGMIFLGFLVCR